MRRLLATTWTARHRRPAGDGLPSIARGDSLSSPCSCGAILTEAVPRKFILALLCCSTLAAQQLATKYGICVQYYGDFPGHSWKQEPKLTQQEIGTDIPEGVAPLRPVLQLKGRLPGRADDNTIEVTPLGDRSVHDFAKAYPGLNSSAVALRALLSRSQLPGMKALEKSHPGSVQPPYPLYPPHQPAATPL